MNGQLLPPAEPAGVRVAPPWWIDPDSEALRFAAALSLSCLLHGALALLPFLGTSAVETRLAQKGSQKAPAAINAMLAMVGERKYSAPSVPPAVEIKPEAPAVDSHAAEDLTPQAGAEGADLLPLPAQGYYTTDQLTKRPQPVGAIELDSPEIRPIVVSGKIVLRLWINEFGSVADVEIESSELPEAFSRTAVAAFKNLRFAPGERNGLPVGTLMRIEVAYDDGRWPAQ